MVTPIRARVHGFDVLLNEGDTYRAIVAAFPYFNAPLIQLVDQLHRLKGRPLVFVDVGAAIGDTVLLLKQRCPRAVERFICLEGNNEFFDLLNTNMAQFDNVTAIRCLLAREAGQIPDLVLHHPGSAAASGEKRTAATRLDLLEPLLSANVDILKVDVDGSDGEVLQGAAGLLERCAPAVIFEWHPKLIERTGGDMQSAFLGLQASGYNRFLWFNNIGTFSHFEEGYSPGALTRMAGYLLEVNSRADEHFDIIALHPSHELDEVSLAAMDFARAASHMG